MENFTDALKVVLQLHVATDVAAAQNLPYVLDVLSPQSLAPSPHLPKWTARINSLLHSKQVHGRWAGLCLAHRTSLHSKSIMIENAQNWLGIALPNLSRKETPQILAASINLCRIIFCSASDIPEFQRQVCTPNVPKFTSAMLALFERDECSHELKILLLRTLTKTVSLYSNIHRSSHALLSTLCLKFLNGHAPTPTHADVLQAASRLYATLPVTGGKVGATNLWKKCLDDTLAFGWDALSLLQSVITPSGNHPQMEKPHVTIPLNVDRLRCCMTIIESLFQSDIQRPVQIPIGPLVAFSIALLTLNNEQRKTADHVDINIHIIASSVISDVWWTGCNIISSVASHAPHHLTPQTPRLVSCLVYHLERNDTYCRRLPYLKALESLLRHTLPLHSEATANRIARAMIPLISVVLPLQSELESKDTVQQNKGKRKKKRGAGFEGDEIFKTSRDFLFPSAQDGEVVLAVCRVLSVILRNPSINTATHSICCRVLLSILLFLPQRSPSSISPDVTLHRRLLQQVQDVTMDKTLAIVLKAVSNNVDVCSQLIPELLLHPRVPPLVRSMPHVETLSLFHAEESSEEARIRESFGLLAVSPEAATIAPAEPPAPVPLPQPSAALGPLQTAPVPHTLSAPTNSDVSMIDLHPAPVKQQSFKLPEPAPIRTSTSIIQQTPQEDEEDEAMPSIDLDSDSD
ncbi:rRNA processing/ribosome biogenesis-domain-containing protein [Mucidula mucida]|nr:rRNA processing/ribosome biogenesis-domain-containing protein [Mucidula mucida]